MLALAILTTTSALSQGHAQSHKKYDIEFTKVVDSTHGFSAFQSFPAINNRGDVAFTAFRNGYGEGVFRAREEGEKVTTIASTLDKLNSFGNDVAINASGVVAFSASTETGSRALFKGDGAVKTLIADSAVNGLAKFFVGSPAINAAGTVAFSSPLSLPGLPQSIFTGNGGPLTTLLSTSKAGFSTFGNVAINDSGRVVFPGNQSNGIRGIFTVPGTPVDFVDTSKNPEFDSFGDPVINNAGLIADLAFLLSSFPTEIITATASAITPRNDPANPPFNNSEHPSVNNRGAVAFFATGNPGPNDPTGIYLEVSGGHSLIPVIKPGDKLFGSTVLQVDLGRFALNDRFQMAFSYSLADGRSGVAIASFEGESEDEKEGDGR